MVLKTVAEVSANDFLSPWLARGGESVNELRNIYFRLSFCTSFWIKRNVILPVFPFFSNGKKRFVFDKQVSIRNHVEVTICKDD